MSIAKIVFVLVIAGGAYQYWHKQGDTPTNGIVQAGGQTPSDGILQTGGEALAKVFGEAKADAPVKTISSNGFVALPPLDNMASVAVIIFAPENCPSDGAQRANALAGELSRQGIPHTRSSSANFTFSGQNQAELDNVNAVMTGTIPIVFVHGRAKANPSIGEVVDEYRSGKG
ncbi:MAG: hypothetical protein PHP85_04390 [Gallionella sp.]|nr:hypothetical protein [Gallionella sp.]